MRNTPQSIPNGLQKRIDYKLARRAQQKVIRRSVLKIRHNDDIADIRDYVKDRLAIIQVRMPMDEITGIMRRLHKMIEKNEADALRLRPGDRMRLMPDGTRLEETLRNMISTKGFIIIDSKYASDEDLEKSLSSQLQPTPDTTGTENEDLMAMAQDLNSFSRPLPDDIVNALFRKQQNGYSIVPLHETEWGTKTINASDTLLMGIWGATGNNNQHSQRLGHTFVATGCEGTLSKLINIKYLQTDLGAEKITPFILRKK